MVGVPSPGEAFEESCHDIGWNVRRRQAEVHHTEKPRTVLGVHDGRRHQPVERIIKVWVLQIIRLGGESKENKGRR